MATHEAAGHVSRAELRWAFERLRMRARHGGSPAGVLGERDGYLSSQVLGEPSHNAGGNEKKQRLFFRSIQTWSGFPSEPAFKDLQSLGQVLFS